MLFQLVFHQRQREFRAKDRDPQLSKHPGQRSNVVFMPVGQHNAAHFIAVVQQIGNVRDDDIHAEQFGLREHQTGIDNDNVVTVAHGHAVHSKFAEAAKGYKMEFMGGHGQQMMLSLHSVASLQTAYFHSRGAAPLAAWSGSQLSCRSFIGSERTYCATASITVGDGVSVPSSPSHRATTALARQLPRTLVAVRAMSMNWSMPRISRTGHAGRWKESSVPRRITRTARGTPATPLLVSISVKTMTSCWPKVRYMPAACATKMDASER